MSNTKKVVLIVTGVALVCLIGAGIILGISYTQASRDGHDVSNFFGLFSGSRVTVEETHELKLDGISALSVECASGNVTVQPGTEAKVEMTGSLWTPEQKDEYISVTQEGERLNVKLDIDSTFFNWVDIDIVVTIPEDSGLNLNVAAASANTVMQQLTLGDVSIGCASGKVEINDVTGGALDVGTASGVVRVANSEFTSIRTNCQSGDIDIRDTKAPATVHCTSGRVNITDVTGALDISNTSGGVTVDLSQKDIEPIKVNVTSGTLNVYLNGEAAFDLYASTTSGGIHCDFDRLVSGNGGGSIVGDKISGECNGGGVSVTLETVSGGINIKKK